MKTVRIAGSGQSWPVGKILCLGRNYREHAREMHAEVPAEPVVFLKPSTAILSDGAVLHLPPFSNDVHHEVEMVVLIRSGGRAIDRADAMAHVGGYGIGLDLTLRDVQARAKKAGLPWTVAKGFDGSAPVSDFLTPDRVPDPHRLALSLSVNGEPRQAGTTADMIFPVDVIVSYLSGIFTLEPGDLIFTGTPEGVGPIRPGDRLAADLGGLISLSITVA